QLTRRPSLSVVLPFELLLGSETPTPMHRSRQSASSDRWECPTRRDSDRREKTPGLRPSGTRRRASRDWHGVSQEAKIWDRGRRRAAFFLQSIAGSEDACVVLLVCAGTQGQAKPYLIVAIKGNVTPSPRLGTAQRKTADSNEYPLRRPLGP